MDVAQASWPSIVAGTLFLLCGFFLDFVNIYLAWLSHVGGKRFVSGVPLIPFVCYLIGWWGILWRPSPLFFAGVGIGFLLHLFSLVFVHPLFKAIKASRPGETMPLTPERRRELIQATYEALNEAIATTEQDSCESDFYQDAFEDKVLNDIDFNGRPLSDVVDWLDGFFVSYSHGDPDTKGESGEAQWKRVFGIRSELQSALGIEVDEPPAIPR